MKQNRSFAFSTAPKKRLKIRMKSFTFYGCWEWQPKSRNDSKFYIFTAAKM